MRRRTRRADSETAEPRVRRRRVWPLVLLPFLPASVAAVAITGPSTTTTAPVSSTTITDVSTSAAPTTVSETPDWEAVVVETTTTTVAASPTVLQLIDRDPRLTAFATTIRTTGVADQLDAAGPITVFAPTNKAFDALGEGMHELLLKVENRGELAKVLRYHVAATALQASAQVTQLTTLNGATLNVTADSRTMWVASPTQSTQAGVPGAIGSNGQIFLIDALLMPPDFAVSAIKPVDAPTRPESRSYEITFAKDSTVINEAMDAVVVQIVEQITASPRGATVQLTPFAVISSRTGKPASDIARTRAEVVADAIRAEVPGTVRIDIADVDETGSGAARRVVVQVTTLT